MRFLHPFGPMRIQSANRAVAVGSLIVVGSLACSSLPARDSLSDQELTIIRADSAVFEAVVRGQLAGTEKAHPYHLDSMRFDSRPQPTGYGNPYGEVVTRIDSTTLLKRLGPVIMDRLAKGRKQILSLNGASEGRPCPLGWCVGMLVEPRPLRPGSQTRPDSILANPHRDCPKTGHSYLKVSLPIPGVPDAVARELTRRASLPGPQRGQLVDPAGIAWTAIVETYSVGQTGGMVDEYAWLFRRNPSTGRLELADTVMLMVAE